MPFWGIKTIIWVSFGVFTALTCVWAVNSLYSFILMCLSGLNPKYQVLNLCVKPKGGLGVFLGDFDMILWSLLPKLVLGP